MEALRAGAIEIAVLRDVPPDVEFESRPLLDEPLIALIPSCHPQAEKERLHLADLAEEPFIVFRPEISPRLHGVLLDACSRAGFAPRVEQEVEEWHTIVGLVGLGLGVSLGPRAVGRIRHAAVRFVDLAETGSRATCHVAWRRDGLSAAGARLLRELHQGCDAGTREANYE